MKPNSGSRDYTPVHVAKGMRRVDKPTSRLASALEKYAMGIVIGSLLLTVLLVSQLIPLPEFSTDVSDFAPPNESEDRIQAIESEFPPQMSRIYVNVKASENVGDPLSIDALNTLYQKSNFVDNLAQEHGVIIGSHINVARILDTLITEQSPSSDLSDMSGWGDIVDAIQDDEDCTSLAGETAVTSAASYAVSTLVSEDLQFEGICDYLEGIDGADPTPTASSTMWVIEVSEASGKDSIRSFSLELRNGLSQEGQESGSVLSYSVVSEDLVSEDINSGTLSNFTILLAASLIVIVGILALAFRSTVMVAAPLVALTAALSWTYGLVALFGYEFTVLDIAVAPVILGLGIDYGIHLQRGYELNISKGMKPARAWVESFDLLRLALSLSVITTVAAFLSNAFSPIMPLRAFGITLAIGVVCAFTASTITVGAIHVVSERSTGRHRSRKQIEYSVWRRASRLQDRSLTKVVSIVAILTLASAAVSVGRLETSFELTDFLDDDMQSIETRNEIYDNYEVEFVKTAIILIEITDQGEIPGDDGLMETIRGLHSRLVLDEMVIRPDGTEDSRPQYEGLYTVLRDRLEIDSEWGQDFGIELFDGEVGLSSDHSEGDLSLAISALMEDESLGDPLRGNSWSDRIANTVSIDPETGALRYLMIDVAVRASSSEDTDAITDSFSNHVKWLEGDGECSCSAYLSGEIIVIESVLDGLFISQVESTALSLVASFFVLMAMTRRFSTSAVIILPVALAGVWVVGTMAVVGLNWNVLTVMITALTIGLGIDYSIHMWRRFEDELEAGANRVEAMATTYSVTGTALMMSAFTTASGFLVLLLSPVPVIQDFGFVSAASVALSLILALFVLPALLLSEAKSRGA